MSSEQSGDGPASTAGESSLSAEKPSENGSLGRKALLNSAQLTAALLLSWVLSLAGRFLLPQLLGREDFGELAFVESIAVLALSLMAFGVGGYIRKEVSADPSLAASFEQPVRRIQITAGLGITATMMVAVALTSGFERGIVALAFGLAQVAIVLGQMNAAYLHAKHDVRVVSISTVVTKLIWFILLLAIFGAGARMLALPLALLASETIRTVWLNRAMRTSYGAKSKAPLRNGRAVIAKSTPYYINTVNVIFMEYSVRILVGVLGSTDAVGLLTTAILASSVPLLLTPILDWVAVPVFTSVRAAGTDSLWLRVGQMIDLLAVIFLAGGVVLFALSDVLMPLMFGNEYASAGPAFAILALAVPATYFTQIVGSAFIADGRTWQNTKVNLYTMLLVVIGVIGVLLWSGSDDAGGVAWRAALVILIGELVTVVTLTWLRPFGGLRPLTLIRLVLVAIGLAVAAIEKIGTDSTTLRVVAVVIVVAVALSDVPRVIGHGREVLRSGDPNGSASSATT